MRQQERRLKALHRLLRLSVQRRFIIPFLDGMADRLHRRIWDMKPPAPTGTGLVVLHKQLIDDALKDEGLDFTSRKTRSSRDHEASYRDGVKAGDRVSLNKGLRQSGQVGLLT